MSDIVYRHKIITEGKGCVVLTDREFNNRIKDIDSLIDSGAETRYLDNGRICVITSVWRCD